MKKIILVTGAKGFIGKHLCLYLKNKGYKFFEYDVDSSLADLKYYISKAQVIVHLAGVNRPNDEEDFDKVNVGFTKKLIKLVKESERKIKIIFASSSQVRFQNIHNLYGISKRKCEELLIKFSKQTKNKLAIMRLDNVFGMWCKPNYNSVIATFCYNIAHDLPITIDDPQKKVNFVHVSYVCEAIEELFTHHDDDPFVFMYESHCVSIEYIANLIRSFKGLKANPFVSYRNDFEYKMYSTYLSYIPKDEHSHSLEQHKDERGSFIELLKNKYSGQVSLNIIKPGFIKGNHYHLSKIEKFYVIKGECEIALRNINEKEVYKHRASSDNLEVIDIPVGYAHSIKNVGKEDALVIMWVNEMYNEKKPDTYIENVE